MTDSSETPPKLPNASAAFIDDQKITGYLLSETNPRGRHKAIVFKRFGFSKTSVSVMIDALCAHGRDGIVAKSNMDSYGKRYIVEGIVDTPSGRKLMLRTVWIIDSGETKPRLVTALPLK